MIRARSIPKALVRRCRQYSRAYLHHLMRSGELLGMMLLSWANIAYYQELMQGIRQGDCRQAALRISAMRQKHSGNGAICPARLETTTEENT